MVDSPWTLKFRNRKADAKGDKRLVEIRKVIASHAAVSDLAVIESAPGYGTGSAALQLVHGVAREALARHNVQVLYLAPSALKKWVTGTGKAGKDDMLAAVPDDVRSAWDEDVDDNGVDAFWLRQIGLKYLGQTYVHGMADDVYDVLAMMKEVK